MNQNAGQGTGLRERDGINVIHTRMQVIIVAWQDAKNHFIVSPFAGPRAGSRSLFLVFRALFIGLMKQKKNFSKRRPVNFVPAFLYHNGQDPPPLRSRLEPVFRAFMSNIVEEDVAPRTLLTLWTDWWVDLLVLSRSPSPDTAAPPDDTPPEPHWRAPECHSRRGRSPNVFDWIHQGRNDEPSNDSPCHADAATVKEDPAAHSVASTVCSVELGAACEGGEGGVDDPSPPAAPPDDRTEVGIDQALAVDIFGVDDSTSQLPSSSALNELDIGSQGDTVSSSYATLAVLAAARSRAAESISWHAPAQNDIGSGRESPCDGSALAMSLAPHVVCDELSSQASAALLAKEELETLMDFELSPRKVRHSNRRARTADMISCGTPGPRCTLQAFPLVISSGQAL